jgi:hypothetical protein
VEEGQNAELKKAIWEWCNSAATMGKVRLSPWRNQELKLPWRNQEQAESDSLTKRKAHL